MGSKRGVINEFFDLQEAQRQKKEVSDMVKEYLDLVKEAQPIRVDLRGAESIKGVYEGMKKLNTANNESIKIASDASKAAEEYIKKLKDQETKQRAVDKAFAEAKVTKQQYNKEIKTEIELQNAANGSIKQAQALIKNLTAERNNLNLTTEEGRKRQAELNAEIDRQNDFIRANVDTLSKQKINIGNYEGSAKIVVDALERTRQKLVEVEKEFGKSSPEAKNLRTEFEALQRVTDNPQFLNIAAKVGDTNKELSFFTQRLNELEDAGLKNSVVYRDVRARLAQLTDQIGDTRAEIKAMSSDTRSFDLFASSVKTLASVWQTAAGAAQLFGADTENVERSIQRLVAIQSVANGVQQIATDITNKATAAGKAYNFVLQQGSILFGKASTAAQRFGAALKFTAIGFGITLLAKAVDALGLFGGASDTAAKKVDRLSLALDRQNQILDDNIRKIDNQTALRIARAKEAGQTEAQINAITIAGLGQTAAAAQRSATNQLQLLKSTLNLYGIQVSGAKDAQDAIDFFKNRGAEKEVALLEKVKSAFTEAETARNKIALTNAEFRAKQAEDLRKKSNKSEGKDDKDRLAELEANRRAEFEILQTRVELYKENDTAILENEDLSFSERLAGLIAYVNDSKKLILAQSAFEKEQKGLTGKEIEAIQEKTNASLYRLQQEFYQKLNDLTKDAFKIDTSGLADNIKPLESVWERLQKEGQKYLEDQKDIKQKLKDAYKDLANELEGLFFDIFQNNIENEKNAIQDQIDLLESQKQKDIEVANQTIVNEQKKADAISVIEARAAAQRQQLELRQRKLDQEKARWEKAESIARIIQSTAEAIAEALPNIPLSIIVGAIGAAQLVRAIATPIPRYFRGRKENDPYEGPAWVDDGGKPEAIVRKSGDVEIGTNKPRITWLNRGDRVLPDAHKALLTGLIMNQERATAPRPIYNDNGFEKLADRMDKGFDKLNNTIKNKREIRFDRPSAMERIKRFKDGNKDYFRRNGFDV